ncbi:dicarboxylate/amino acid:cation symporter [Clostridium carnis]
MKKSFGLTTKIFISMIFGCIFGLFIKSIPDGYFKDTFLLNGLIKILGNGFLATIKMMVVPLVLVSLTCGASSIGNIKKLGRVGGKTFIFYLITTCIAITIAIGIAYVINPGTGLDMSHLVTQETIISEGKNFTDLLLGIIPLNPIESMVKGDMLQIIFFSILLGLSISLVGKKAEPVKKLFESSNEVIMKIVQMLMSIAPYGVFALIANTFATTGFNAMIPLLKYMSVILISLSLHGLIIYFGMFKIFTGLKIRPFLKRFIAPGSIVFSTASSNAALPVTLEAMEEAGVDNSIASFTIPLGSTINMDGTAIMQGAAAIFIAQIYNIELGLGSIITIIATATLASIGTAGVPGVGMVMLSMVLQSVGLPIEGIGLILGVDRILDMCRSTLNTMGDCICTIIISKSENAFNEEKYYSVDSNSLEDAKIAS